MNGAFAYAKMTGTRSDGRTRLYYILCENLASVLVIKHLTSSNGVRRIALVKYMKGKC